MSPDLFAANAAFDDTDDAIDDVSLKEAQQWRCKSKGLTPHELYIGHLLHLASLQHHEIYTDGYSEVRMRGEIASYYQLTTDPIAAYNNQRL